MNLPEARRTFKDGQVAHVGSLLPDGSPHVVPLWFVWLEDAVFVSCREGSQVWRNLTRDPRVAVQFDRGRAWSPPSGLSPSSLLTSPAALPVKLDAVGLPPSGPSSSRTSSVTPR